MVNNKVKIGGIISKVQKILLKNQNKTMVFATLEDIKGKIELLVFPKILEATEGIWAEDNVILAEGKLSDKEGVFKLIVDSVKVINQAELENFKRIEATGVKNGGYKSPSNSPFAKGEAKKIIIYLPSSATKDSIKKLSAFFDKCELGSHKIFLQIGGNKLETPYCIKDFEGFKESLQKLIPEGKINIF